MEFAPRNYNCGDATNGPGAGNGGGRRTGRGRELRNAACTAYTIMSGDMTAAGGHNGREEGDHGAGGRQRRRRRRGVGVGGGVDRSGGGLCLPRDGISSMGCMYRPRIIAPFHTPVPHARESRRRA